MRVINSIFLFLFFLISFPSAGVCDKNKSSQNLNLIRELPKSFIELTEEKKQNGQTTLKILFDCFCSPSSFIIDSKNLKLDLSKICNPAGIWHIKNIRTKDHKKYVLKLYSEKAPHQNREIVITLKNKNTFLVDLGKFSSKTSYYANGDKYDEFPNEKQDCGDFDG